MQFFPLVINHDGNTVTKSHEIWNHINKGRKGLWIVWGNLCKEREEERLALLEEPRQIYILILKSNCCYNYLRLSFSCVSQDEALFSFPLISCAFCSLLGFVFISVLFPLLVVLPTNTPVISSSLTVPSFWIVSSSFASVLLKSHDFCYQPENSQPELLQGKHWSAKSTTLTLMHIEKVGSKHIQMFN